MVGILQPAKEWKERQMLQDTEMITKWISACKTYQRLQEIEDYAIMCFLYKYSNSEPLYKLLINQIQIRKVELAAMGK